MGEGLQGLHEVALLVEVLDGGVGEGGWGRVGWSDFGRWPAIVWSWPGRIDRAKERKGKMDEGNGSWAWSLSSILFYYFQPHEVGHPRLEKESM